MGDWLPLVVNWQNFYLITGAAAATLTGLMFIVITLMANLEGREEVANAGVSAFSTPTVINFCSVLLMSVLFSIPWQSFTSVRLVLSILAFAEIIYYISVMPWIRRIPNYQTPIKDWPWYLIAPLCAYIVLLLAAIILPVNSALALYLIASVMITVQFTGIRNAWDLVTFLAVFRTRPGE